MENKNRPGADGFGAKFCRLRSSGLLALGDVVDDHCTQCFVIVSAAGSIKDVLYFAWMFGNETVYPAFQPAAAAYACRENLNLFHNFVSEVNDGA